MAEKERDVAPAWRTLGPELYVNYETATNDLGKSVNRLSLRYLPKGLKPGVYLASAGLSFICTNGKAEVIETAPVRIPVSLRPSSD